MKYLLFAGFANVTRQLGVEHSDRAQGWIRFKYIYFFLLSPPPPLVGNISIQKCMSSVKHSFGIFFLKKTHRPCVNSDSHCSFGHLRLMFNCKHYIYNFYRCFIMILVYILESYKLLLHPIIENTASVLF